jgi:hypothetical protein
MNITLTPVESSQIAAIGFDATTKTLAIQFKKKAGPGSVYHYDNVPADVYQAFVAAESKGRFFGANIKGNADFTYRKIEPERKDEDAATEEV